MNKHVTTSQAAPGSNWERPVMAPPPADNRSEADIDLWWALVDAVIAAAKTNGWTKAEVARRIGMADGTFSQWFSGKYAGRLDSTNRTVEQWVAALEDNAAVAATIPQSPPFMKMRGSSEILDTLMWAQLCPDLVMVTLGAGMGKTETCTFFERSRRHVYRATVSENTKTVHGMLTELAEELDVREHNPARLARAIGNKIRRAGDGTLLIVDEGQHLNDEAINQLRHFVDVYKCGVAIVGNAEVYTRFSKDRKKNRSYDQLKSRIGKRLQRTEPYAEDLVAYVKAWGIEDNDCAKFLIGIGKKGGAFRQIDKTMKLATMYANGSGTPVSLIHITEAWKNRDVEDMA
ncbi:AAA family ATPase [Shinella kummerowiae]|uniref:AAA family ATPase n=1 Tax=Shinella kummerowiae TaxID=417745 RepID=UPI0021B52918|nr:AAA family ATPase [Shinella kummerowiae]MCT7667648.1 AAA family ATPase [Shinella kummerowiae]